MLAALCALIEARDPYTRGHSTRTAALGVALAERLGWGGALVGAVRLGGLLHDIGKVTVSEHVLRKPGPLEPVERNAIRRHPVTGAHLVRLTPETRAALPAVLFHHERWDGRGDPLGRTGVEIPAEARVLAVADAFDAMTSTRPYRRALSVTEALNELVANAGTQFDPRFALTFVEMWDDAGATAAAAS
jgi:putative nucleotidyltransferase with HDIG domain